MVNEENNKERNVSEESSSYIVHGDPYPVVKRFHAVDRKRFDNIKKPEKQETGDKRPQRQGNHAEGHELAGHFVNDLPKSSRLRLEK
jgi:hypothetical protein